MPKFNKDRDGEREKKNLFHISMEYRVVLFFCLCVVNNSFWYSETSKIWMIDYSFFSFTHINPMNAFDVCL